MPMVTKGVAALVTMTGTAVAVVLRSIEPPQQFWPASWVAWTAPFALLVTVVGGIKALQWLTGPAAKVLFLKALEDPEVIRHVHEDNDMWLSLPATRRLHRAHIEEDFKARYELTDTILRRLAEIEEQVTTNERNIAALVETTRAMPEMMRRFDRLIDAMDRAERGRETLTAKLEKAEERLIRIDERENYDGTNRRKG